MKWIVGLGNPGKQYEQTRHNIGFMVIDELADRMNITMNQSKFKALVGEGHFAGEKVYLIKPMTYMNLSGEALRAFHDFYKIELEDMLVIYDDLDTEVGRIRLRYQGSAGGHNGIKSIIQHFGTMQFNRIRMGISRPPQGFNIADYVLSTFRKEELDALNKMINRAADATEYLFSEHFEKAMAKFNV